MASSPPKPAPAGQPPDASTQGVTQPSGPSDLARSILSLLLFIHFFCVFTVLASTYLRSPLQARLVSIFGVYTELLAFDPGQFTPFFYTHGRTRDDDATFSLDLYPESDAPVAQRQLIKTIVLPHGGSNWLGERLRTIVLARQLAYFADPEVDRDDLAAEIARGVSSRVMREHGARAAVLRCTRRLSQPLDLSTLLRDFPPDNPAAPAYDELVYVADVFFDEDNEPQAIRRQAAAEVAPRRTSVPRGQGPGARSQEPGARSQEPGARGQVSGASGERGASAP
jgi:hypothetical protein